MGLECLYTIGNDNRVILYYSVMGWVGLGHDILEIHFNIGNDNRVILYYSVMGWVGLGWVGS